MRLKSGRSAKWLKLLYLLAILSLVFDLIIINIDGSLSAVSKVSPIAVVILVFLWHKGPSEFLYDSDGEVLNLTSRDPNLIWISRKLFTTHSEFPKRKLASYKVNRILFRRTLVIRIKSKNGSFKKEKFAISFLSRSELTDLKKSLHTVVQNNKIKNG